MIKKYIYIYERLKLNKKKERKKDENSCLKA